MNTIVYLDVLLAARNLEEIIEAAENHKQINNHPLWTNNAGS